jgi:O-acetyl-ADP-ribose deacetylase (regulator of RNase III)
VQSVKVVQVDITTLRVDAIVNAANTSLLGGGGVDGAIHDAAGPSLLEECMRLGGCETGDVKVTSGHDLPAKFIFHAVGPVWQAGKKGEAGKLKSCYRRAIEIANQLGVRSIAFPAISCGAFRYPADQAAEIAISTVGSMLSESRIDSVLFAILDPYVADAYRLALTKSQRDR